MSRLKQLSMIIAVRGWLGCNHFWSKGAVADQLTSSAFKAGAKARRLDSPEVNTGHLLIATGRYRPQPLKRSFWTKALPQELNVVEPLFAEF
jgi:hypothetical protein